MRGVHMRLEIVRGTPEHVSKTVSEHLSKGAKLHGPLETRVWNESRPEFDYDVGYIGTYTYRHTECQQAVVYDVENVT